MNTVICPKCNQTVPVDQMIFNYHDDGSPRLQTRCIPCARKSRIRFATLAFRASVNGSIIQAVESKYRGWTT
jgi:RNase P subunit RPR2